MWRIFVLMLGGLLFPLSPAVIACGEPSKSVVPQPLPKGDYVKKIIAVELQGKVVVVRCLMFGRTSVGVTVGNETYWLDVRHKKDLQSVLQYGKTVLVSGTLDDPQVSEGKKDYLVNVTDVRAVGRFTITLGRTSGIPDFNPMADVTFDSTKLSDTTATELRKLIGDAKFFSLHSSMDPPLDIPDPPAGYNLTVEMDGKKHSIWVTNEDMTPPLSALVSRLKEVNTEVFCRKLIGMDFEEAKREITAAGYKHRLASKDGSRFLLTTDWCPNRINLVVEKGKVVEASAG